MLALLMVDIDNFKSINDNYGHQNGDKVIISMAEILKKICRSYDTVSRYSGEEFCIILPENTIKTTHTIAYRILKSIAARKFDFCNRKITASIGISLFPEHTEKKDELIGMADIALYVSKIAGKNMYTFYSSEMDTGFLQKQAEKHRARLQKYREETLGSGMGWVEM